MVIQYLLIGYEKDGEIFEEDELKQRITIFPEAVVGSNRTPPVSNLPRSFDVQMHIFEGKRYAVGIARSTNGSEIDDLIQSSGVSPLPD